MNEIVTSAIRTDASYQRHALENSAGLTGSSIVRKRTWTQAHTNVAWMLAIVLLGLVARLFRIDHQPLWLDEALTVQRIHLGLNGLVADSFANRHMPTYFLLLRLA